MGKEVEKCIKLRFMFPEYDILIPTQSDDTNFINTYMYIPI